jgi:hypothetical protein
LILTHQADLIRSRNNEGLWENRVVDISGKQFAVQRKRILLDKFKPKARAVAYQKHAVDP